MKKFLLPLTTALAALLSHNPVSEAHTPANNQLGDASYLMPIAPIHIPEGISSLVLAKQSTDIQMAVIGPIVPIGHIHPIDPIAPIDRHANIGIVLWLQTNAYRL
jgi:hypothetical protein